MNLCALAVFAGALPTVIWGYLLLARGGFWQVRRSLAPMTGTVEVSRPIAVIIPARNEESVIAQSIASLLRQTCVQSMHIFLVDDPSSDRTAELAEDSARQAGGVAVDNSSFTIPSAGLDGQTLGSSARDRSGTRSSPRIPSTNRRRHPSFADEHPRSGELQKLAGTTLLRSCRCSTARHWPRRS